MADDERDYPGVHGSFSEDLYRCFCDPSRSWSMVGCPRHLPREQELRHLLREWLRNETTSGDIEVAGDEVSFRRRVEAALRR